MVGLIVLFYLTIGMTISFWLDNISRKNCIEDDLEYGTRKRDYLWRGYIYTIFTMYWIIIVPLFLLGSGLYVGYHKLFKKHIPWDEE